MSTVPTLSFNELIKLVKKLGFHKARQRGSHIRFEHPDGRKTTIPDHGNKDVPHGLMLKSIRNDLEMDLVDFFEKQSNFIVMRESVHRVFVQVIFPRLPLFRSPGFWYLTIRWRMCCVG